MREDFKDAPDWITGLLNPLNSFMSSVYYALDKDLTFTENIASSVKKITFTTRSDYSSNNFEVQRVFNPLKTKPSGVVIAKIVNLIDYSNNNYAQGMYWDYLDGYIRINNIAGLSDSTKYEITLLIF